MKSQTIAVLGDLHYESPWKPDFDRAHEQICHLRPDAVFQLGDHGGYSHCGTWQSFLEGRDFLSAFEVPYYTILGNHDMEGPEYRTDAASVAAWCRAFRKERPYEAIDFGDALAVCLSTTTFRSNPNCPHEVRLDQEQIAWFRGVLEQHRGRPTFVFSHAPIIGSGLRVLQSIHLRCPNAWLNHTQDPGQFIRLLADHPQVKLWFSAHNHLGHHYPDSISKVGNCHFVHTGVISEVSRDDCRQSRWVQLDASGFTLSTIDHVTEELTSDLRHEYATGRTEQLRPAADFDETYHFAPPPFPRGPDGLRIGRSAFAVHRGMIVEFDVDLAAPIGVVCDGINGHAIRIDGGNLVIEGDKDKEVFRPKAGGWFSRVFEPNPRLAC